MKQGWKLLCVGAALMTALAVSAPATHAATKSAAASKSGETSSRSKRSLRQFTGVVTAHDKISITVEKGGKNAKTMTFSKSAEMKTTGELEDAARVTVYYRDEGGKSIAHKVVVKKQSASTD